MQKKGANHNVFRSHGNSNYPVKLVIHLSFYTAASTIQLHTYNTTTLQENLTHNPNAKQIFLYIVCILHKIGYDDIL